MTYFSNFNSKWNTLYLNYPEYEIRLGNCIDNRRQLFIESLNKNLNKELDFFIHSSDVIPNNIDSSIYEYKNKIFYYKPFTYNYFMFKVHLLPPHYETNCRIYQMHDKYNHMNSRSDCIKHCIITLIKEKYQANCLNLKYTFPILTEQYLKHNTEYICYNYTHNSNKSTKNDLYKSSYICEHKCPRHCSEQLFEISHDHLLEDNESVNSSTTMVTIKHNNSPDHIILHMPEIDFIHFISNLGGLIGMWLGMSVLFTFNYLFSLL